jgi:type IV secretion system protein VirB9
MSARRILLPLLAASCLDSTVAAAADPRMKEIEYDGKSVINLHVARGVATAIELDPSDAISFAATGVGADCAKEIDSWCIAALPNSRVIFVKPKSFASGSNNLQIVSSLGRFYSFHFDILGRTDPRPPIYRLTIKAPRQAAADSPGGAANAPGIAVLSGIAPSNPRDLVRERLHAEPRVVNSRYSIALGAFSDDIVPSTVFDDGRFTYLRFAANREIPAVFQIGQDGLESLVNARTEGDLLVVDRVARRLNLRLGRQVVGVFNDAFDPKGLPPLDGTTATGVERALRPEAARELQP